MVMEEDNLSQIYTWSVAAYGVHPYLKSHTCGGIPFGYGTVHWNSSKQKLNTKICTWGVVVGSSD